MEIFIIGGVVRLRGATSEDVVERAEVSALSDFIDANFFLDVVEISMLWWLKAGRRFLMDEVLSTRGSGKSGDGRRRVPGAPKKCYQVTEMWDMHHEIARRIVLGQKNVAIANALGVSATLVSNVRNSPVVRDKIDLLRGTRDANTVDIAAQIKEIAPDALEVLRQVIEDGEVSGEKIPARLRAHHSEKLLDRAGHGAPKIIQASHLHGHFTTDDINEIKARATQLGITSGTVVDEAVEEAVYDEVENGGG